MPQIIDVIQKKGVFDHVHTYIVVDEMPKYVYARHSEYFIAHDDGFYDFLKGRAGKGQAFAGRSLEIALDDGSNFLCEGEVWSSGHGGYVSEQVLQVGIATLEKLRDCYVFFGSYVSAAKLQAWLDHNKPSGNYYKYDPRNTVEWLDSVYTTGSRPICVERARTLKRRGVRIFKDENGNRSWSPAYEHRKQQILKEREE